MIANGAQVKIHYKLYVDGKLVDSSEGREPLTYIQGQGQIVPGLESQLSELDPGDTARVEVEPEQAYGAVNEDAVQTLPRDAFEDPSGLEVGRIIQGKTLEGQAFTATVRSLEGAEVTIDLNHPLAGRTLLFEVEILEVLDSESQ